MSMRSEKLFEAIGEVGDEFLDLAVLAPPKKRFPWKRFTAFAAALVLVVGLAPRMMVGMGGSASAPEAAAPESTEEGGGGFTSYAGPILPLTLREEKENITARRDITLDFAPWIPIWRSNEEQLEEARAEGATQEELEEYKAQLADWYEEGGYYQYDSDVLLTDTYVLTNTSSEEQDVSLCYPFVSSLRNMHREIPSVMINGSKLLGEVVPGGYCGGFTGAGGETHEQDSWNLDQPNDWEDYTAVLEDGSYLEQAMGPYPDLTQIPVTMYYFSNAWAAKEKDQDPNPSIRVSFDWDESAATMLSYGFQGGSYDSNHMELSFSVPSSKMGWYKENRMLIFLGEDIQNLSTACYSGGGWDDAVEMEGGVDVVRYEITLDEALRSAAQEMYKDEWQYGEAISCDFEMYYGLMCDYLCTYGLLSEDVKMRYDMGDLESLDFEIVARVFYLCQEYSIAPGDEITVSFTQSKEASFDFYCGDSKRADVRGYDLATDLGSNLSFSEQNVRLEDQGQIEILKDSFGFDLESGIRERELELDEEHYYLEVQRSYEEK